MTAAVKASDVKAPVGVEVSRLWADWERGKLSRFHATVKIAYRQALKPAGRSDLIPAPWGAACHLSRFLTRPVRRRRITFP